MRAPLLLIVVVLAGTKAAAAAPDPFPKVWLNPGFFTHHFSNRDFRGDNYGPGIELELEPRHALLAGSFINSDRERSRYAAYYWRPWRRQAGPVELAAGLAVGLVDGYPGVNSGGWFPAAMPVLSAQYGFLGANLAFIPHPRNGAALALQLKLRVW